MVMTFISLPRIVLVGHKQWNRHGHDVMDHANFTTFY